MWKFPNWKFKSGLYRKLLNNFQSIDDFEKGLKLTYNILKIKYNSNRIFLDSLQSLRKINLKQNSKVSFPYLELRDIQGFSWKWFPINCMITEAVIMKDSQIRNTSQANLTKKSKVYTLNPRNARKKAQEKHLRIQRDKFYTINGRCNLNFFHLNFLRHWQSWCWNRGARIVVFVVFLVAGIFLWKYTSSADWKFMECLLSRLKIKSSVK